MTETTSWFRIAGRAFLPAAMTLTLATCATNPVTGRRELALISEGQEIQMGQEARDQVIASIGLVPDSGLQRYVSGLGLAMARASDSDASSDVPVYCTATPTCGGRSGLLRCM